MSDYIKYHELCRFAPYSLGLQFNTLICHMSGITPSTIYTQEGSVFNWENHPAIGQVIFPILRPMSDLIKPCLSNGLIPLVELAKIEGTYDCTPYYLKQVDDAIGMLWNVENDDDGNKYCVFGYDNQYGFGIHYRPSNIMLTPKNQIKLYDFLAKNHFDVDNLIGRGLAIDINTLTENVYESSLQ